MKLRPKVLGAEMVDGHEYLARGTDPGKDRDQTGRSGRTKPPVASPPETPPRWFDDLASSGWWLLPAGIVGVLSWGTAIWLALF